MKRAASQGPSVLYISYDGLLEPLGKSQILPYVRGLAQRGSIITLLTFEKPHDLEGTPRVALDRDLASHGIRWVALRYHKRPSLPATAYDMARGVAQALREFRRTKYRVVHARSYVPALMGWVLKQLIGVRLLFDMRGFWPDEKIEAGHWSKNGAIYRAVKRIERQLLRDADAIITLTNRAKAAVEQWPGISAAPVTVIPTCVDLARFPHPLGALRTSPPLFVYIGSVGTWTSLGEMSRFVNHARVRFTGARLLVLTREIEAAQRELDASPLPADAVTLDTANPEQMAQWLAQASAALAFYRPGFARQGTCPTKAAEYLAMGLPVIVNEDVGDCRDIIGGAHVGVILRDFSDDAYGRALDELAALWKDPSVPARCRQVAEDTFAVGIGIDRYWQVYERLN